MATTLHAPRVRAIRRKNPTCMGGICAWRSAGSAALRPLRRIGKNLGNHLLAVVRVESLK
jgi:hypothetical protein